MSRKKGPPRLGEVFFFEAKIGSGKILEVSIRVYVREIDSKKKRH